MTPGEVAIAVAELEQLIYIKNGVWAMVGSLIFMNGALIMIYRRMEK